MNRPASLCSATVLLVISFAHLVRMIFGVQIVVNAIAIPMWVSAVPAALLAFLGFWLLMERRSASA